MPPMLDVVNQDQESHLGEEAVQRRANQDKVVQDEADQEEVDLRDPAHGEVAAIQFSVLVLIDQAPKKVA